MPIAFNRREALLRIGAAMASAYASYSQGQPARARLILLGTGGGPRPRAASSASAQVIISHDSVYVVDCGDGVARQLVLAGVPLTALRCIFLTHHHSDHTSSRRTIRR